MDTLTLRELQAPLKQRYKSDPASARTPVSAEADFGEPGVTCTVKTSAGAVRAGLHSATGGDGSDACSGDMLLEAVVACAGVTLRSVATSMGLQIRSAALRAESAFDARGTLAVDRDAPIGLEQIVVTVELDCDADDTDLSRLASATEKYCVVGQSLRLSPSFVLRRVEQVGS